MDIKIYLLGDDENNFIEYLNVDSTNVWRGIYLIKIDSTHSIGFPVRTVRKIEEIKNYKK